MNLRLFLAHTLPELAQGDKGLEQDTPIRLDSCGGAGSEEPQSLICMRCTSAMTSSNMTSPLPLISPGHMTRTHTKWPHNRAWRYTNKEL